MSNKKQQTPHRIEMSEGVQCQATHSPWEIVTEPGRNSSVAELVNRYCDDDRSEKWKLIDKPA
jgi:hypothetical protein